MSNKNVVKWLKKDLIKEAKKYKSRGEFSKKSNGAYHAARLNNWLDEVCSHMDILWEKRWNYEAVRKEALKHKTRNKFRSAAVGAYGAAHRNGWLDQVCSHMVSGRVKWTIDRVKKEAAKYKNRGEFALESGSAYHAASKNSWIDEVCSHMEILYNGYYHCVYSIINKRLNKAYIGVTTQKIENRLIQHRKDNNPCRSKQIINLHDSEFKQETEYVYTSQQVQNFAEKKYINYYRKKRFEILNDSSSIGSVGYSNRIWSLDKCMIIAKRFTSRWEFQKQSPNAYSAAKNHRWLDEVCSHMSESIKRPGYWTKENCKKEALRFKTIKEIREKSSYLYKIVNAKGWYDDVFAHIEMIVLKPWEKSNCNKDVWIMAKGIHTLWRKSNKCSGYVLSKKTQFSPHALNSIVLHFKKGWVPEQDNLWKNWIKLEKRNIS